MKVPRWSLVLAVLLVSGLFGYFLRDVVYEVVIVPLAYLLWVLNFYYSALPQWLVWVLVLTFLFLAGLWNLIPDVRPKRRTELVRSRHEGDVEALAAWIAKSHEGNYFKWQLANRLGRIARRLDDLSGPDGRRLSSDTAVEQYLDAGVNYSFVDFPSRRNPLERAPRTPLDLDPGRVTDYLESQMEKTSDGRR